MNHTDRYTYSVVWSEEDGEYIGLCAEFPYLSFLAPLPDDALAGVRESVTIALGMLAEDGIRPPAARRRPHSRVCVTP